MCATHVSLQALSVQPSPVGDPSRDDLKDQIEVFHSHSTCTSSTASQALTLGQLGQITHDRFDPSPEVGDPLRPVKRQLCECTPRSQVPARVCIQNVKHSSFRLLRSTMTE